MNLSAPRPEGRGLPSTRAQTDRLKVHPEPPFDKLRAVSIVEPRFLPPLSKAGLRAAERVKSPQKYFTPIPKEKKTNL
jgi:hypothetical protein